jgi:sirohydrochlorin ferrochelatase
MSLPSDAPALVLAVPGSYSPASDELAERIASAAQESCRGAGIRIGYLDGSTDALTEVAAEAVAATPFTAAVVVPLLAGPHPRLDAEIERAAARVPGQVIVAGQLAAHPLLAEALHTRLAEAGLARESRARGLSIASSPRGVLVLADRGPDAAKAAGVTAVLLAGRLAVPTAHASIDDRRGIETALARLDEAGAARAAIAPCVIGPETDPAELEAVSRDTGAPLAPVLGAHPAIAQLVAIRYGTALSSLAASETAG